MKKLTVNDTESIYVTDQGYLSIRTPSCGCCSEWYSTEENAYCSDFEISIDELAKHADRLEDDLARLRDYIADKTNRGLDNIVHIDTD